MGKKHDRRRKREKSRAQRSRQAAQTRKAPPTTVDLPPHNPRLRVVIAPNVAPDMRTQCLRYWSVNTDGKWTERVSDIDTDPIAVATAVRNACYVLLLHSACRDCGDPLTALSRSAAIQLVGTHLERTNTSRRCATCSQHHEDARQQQLAAQQAAEQEQRAAEQRQAHAQHQLIHTTLDNQARALPPEDLHRRLANNARGLVTYAALLAQTNATPNHPLPSISELGQPAWTDSPDHDRETVELLIHTCAIVVDPDTPCERFTVTFDDNVTFNPETVRLRLTSETDHATQTLQQAVRYLQQPGPTTAEARKALTNLTMRLEVDAIVRYLDSLLEKKYNYPPTPLNRAVELTNTIHDAFTAGYTPGQLVCLAWRAADTAAAWKERNAGMGPPEAASATVTTLRNKLDSTREKRLPVPEYDVPRWLDLPLALQPARELHHRVMSPWNSDLIAACDLCDVNGWHVDETDRAHRCTHPEPAPQTV